MQKINQILTLFLAIAIAACGGADSSVSSIVAGGDLETIRAKKKELAGQLKQVEQDISILDSAIAANTVNSNLPLVTTIQTN